MVRVFEEGELQPDVFDSNRQFVMEFREKELAPRRDCRDDVIVIDTGKFLAILP